MTLKQLQYVYEIKRHGMHLSLAASSMHTSQPGVSRQIKLLERELGFPIFERRRNRILGFTPMGERIAAFAERTVQEAENVRNCSREINDQPSGKLLIATNHTHARYTLPSVIERFAKRYAAVQLQFWQGSRDEIFRWLNSGEVDLAIGTDCDAQLENIVLLPFGTFHRVVVTPPRHALLRTPQPTLEQIAAHPIITYGSRWPGKWKFGSLFEARKLRPNIVFSAVDSDVSKTYVSLGLGIAILPHIAFNRQEDANLRAIEVRHLFGTEVMHVGLNRRRFYRQYAFDFMELLAPSVLARSTVEKALSAR